MDPQQPLRRIRNLKFRVLIIGRANAGKTSILQRVCDTTDSPIIYRGEEKITLEPSDDRGEHTIDDELIFSNHAGYVFHDSRGIESASTYELGILQSFIQRKCGERRLGDRLHAIWYCVPMDNQRPELDLRFFKDICPDQNVPVIAVFTKYDQFRKNIRINVEDFGGPDDDVSQVTEENFQEYYLRPLGDGVRFVRLEKMHMQDMRCDELIETTAAALNEETTALMLLAVQRGNLEFSVKTALKRVHSITTKVSKVKHIVRESLIPFPYIWWFSSSISPFPFKEEELGIELGIQFKEEEKYSKDFYETFESFFASSSPFGIYGPRPEIGSFSKGKKIEFLEGSLEEHIRSLPTITNLVATGGRQGGRYELTLAVIIILKHATSLRLKNMSPKSALTQADLDYREANTESEIRQHLTASSSQKHSVELSASFIMAIDLSSVKNTRA